MWGDDEPGDRRADQGGGRRGPGRGTRVRRRAPTALARGVRGPGQDQGAVRAPGGGDPSPWGTPRSRAVIGAAGSGEDDIGRHRGERARRRFPSHVRPGPGARRRPRCDPLQPRRGRRPLRRRGASDAPDRGGSAVSGAGGLQTRRDHRQGAFRPEHPARPPAVHARRRDDQAWPHHAAAAGAVRLLTAPGLLLARGAGPGRESFRRHPGDPGGNGGSGGNRETVPRNAPHRQPTPSARPRLRPGPGRRPGHA